MENLNQFTKTNMMNRKEERQLDKTVSAAIDKGKTSILGVFAKLALAIIVFLVIGLGIYLLPEEQQRQVIKPVSAYDVLEKTYNKIQSLINQPGILHYQYVVVTEHEDIDSYDHFERDIYTSTENNKYKSTYVKTRSEGELKDRGLGDGSFQQFPQVDVVIFSDGKKEYFYDYYTENYRNLTPEMIKIEHDGYLSGLLSFYEFLLENDNGQYTLTEKLIEGKQVYVITFDYKGIVMDVQDNGIDYALLEKTYQAEIIIDKESLLPVSNRTNVKDASFVDTQYEKYTSFELLEPEDDKNIFDFNRYMANMRSSENQTNYSNFEYNKEITGEVRQNNPGEDIIEVNFYNGRNKFNIEGNLFQDQVIGKPTIIGKFLSGKTTTLKGFSTKTDYGNVFWIQDIDYSKTHDTNPGISITPKVTVKPSDSVIDVKQSIDKISSALKVFEKTNTLNYTVEGTDGDEVRFAQDYEYDIAKDLMKISATEGSILDKKNDKRYVYYRVKGKYYLQGEYNTPLTEDELFISVHDILRNTDDLNNLLNDSRYSISATSQDSGQNVEVITLQYKKKDNVNSITNLFKVHAEVVLEDYSVVAVISKEGKLLKLTVPNVYGSMTYNFISYDAKLDISIPVSE